jgi:hypothetical protein
MTDKTSLCLSVIVALALGIAVHTGYPWLIILSVLSPAIALVQPSRMAALLIAFVYYQAALCSLPGAVAGFFAPGIFREYLAWLAAAILLSLPWLIVWGNDHLCLRAVTGVLIGTIPPLGLIGWASPLLAAGWLFPDVGLTVGLAMTLVLTGLIAEAHRWTPVVGGIIALSVGCNIAVKLVHKQHPAPRWEGVTLHNSRNADAVKGYYQVLAMQSRAESSSADVIVLPEGSVDNWSAVTEFQWADTFSDLQRKHHIVLIGATSLEGGRRYHNGFVIRGQQVDRFEQRVPAPLAMWVPFSTSVGAPLRLFAPGTVKVGKDRVGVLVCYEMTIPWPAIATLAEDPTRLVGLANDWWSASTPSVPRWQATALEGWARLAGIESTLAINLPKAVRQ